MTTHIEFHLVQFQGNTAKLANVVYNYDEAHDLCYNLNLEHSNDANRSVFQVFETSRSERRGGTVLSKSEYEICSAVSRKVPICDSSEFKFIPVFSTNIRLCKLIEIHDDGRPMYNTTLAPAYELCAFRGGNNWQVQFIANKAILIGSKVDFDADFLFLRAFAA